MSLFRYLLVATTLAAACVRALPPNMTVADGSTSLLPTGVPPPNTEGYSDGFYYQTWSDGDRQVAFTNGPGGQFGLTWAYNNVHVTVGKGWNPGSSNRIINYKGSYLPNGGGCYFWIHGWTTNPLTEYFIVDYSSGEGTIYSAAQRKGTVSCNGATYDVLQGTRYDIFIDGVRVPVKQFWSVRYPKKYPNNAFNSTVDVACHIKGWKGFGMELGTNFDYQIVALDNYFTSGSANLTVSEG